MEFHQARYVLAAARTLNFTKAAEECRVSQPALTKAIKTLEDELEAPLFRRESNRVMLTDFGHSLLPHLMQMLQEAEAARILAENFKLVRNTPVKVGVMATIGPVRLSRFLASFHKSFDSVEVTVSEGNMTDVKRRLDDGEFDLAVMNTMGGMGDGYRIHDLYSERYVVIIPPEHPLAALNAIRLGQLTGENYVDRLACEMRETVMAVCAQNKIELYARFRSEREDWIQSMVMARIGFAFMPECAVTLPDLLRRPLIDPEVSRTVSLVSMAGRRYSPATAALVRAAQSFNWAG